MSNVIPFVPRDMRLVYPSPSLTSSTGCRMHYILTVGNVLIDAHELAAMRAGAKFTDFGYCSGDTLIAPIRPAASSRRMSMPTLGRSSMVGIIHSER